MDVRTGTEQHTPGRSAGDAVTPAGLAVSTAEAESLAAHLAHVRAHRAELHESMSAVGAALDSPLARGGMWRERVRAALAELSHDFDDHVSLTESSGGVYERAAHAAPRLSGPAGRLRAEHVGLRDSIRGYLAVLEHGGTMADLPVFREEVARLVTRLVRHRSKGDDMLHEAYDVDLGGSD
ncbi:hemerythrin domain-containing protein [Intrasporangium sp. YIM S08009]|uniref:hemerythrin domain-containing protein n=1 Tax=Intrasporangium zincisolvens TaxID=3080018 RepID=UPI002B061168|nr:hemerythrin domain-containing protein [Intrasporangium sp. YIM S08009]